MQYTQTCKNSPGSITPTAPSLPSAQLPVEVGHAFARPSLQLQKLVQGVEISWGLQEHHESCIRSWEKLPPLLSIHYSIGEISIAGLLNFLIKDPLQILLWKEEWVRKLRCSRGSGMLQMDGSERLGIQTQRTTTNPSTSRNTHKQGDDEKCSRDGYFIYAAEKVIGTGKLEHKIVSDVPSVARVWYQLH